MYAYQLDVPMPLEVYDRVHAEVERRLTGDLAVQWLVHMVVRIEGGFRVTDVWRSHEAADRFGDEIMRPIIGEVVGADAAAAGPPPSEELDVHHLQVNERAIAAA